MAADGELKVTLSGIGNGLTRDINNRMLLPDPLVLQCGPMEEYVIAHTFNMGTYDTIDDDQYSRRGSRQLDTWQFDTVMLYVGVGDNGESLPNWVPYPTKEEGGQTYRDPWWYVEQIRALFLAGAPFHYVAAFPDLTIHTTHATLTAFSESYKAAEDDAIYFTGLSFMEWRDPRGQTTPAPFPAYVKFDQLPTGNPPNRIWRWIAYDTKTPGQYVKTKSATTGTSFSDLARAFYGDGSKWRQIADANKCTGGSGDSAIIGRWFAKTIQAGPVTPVGAGFRTNKQITIPKPT